MRVELMPLPGVLLIRPDVFPDARGHFLETWRASTYAEIGVGAFVQDSASTSRRGVVRGLHCQWPPGQAKLIGVTAGEAFDVAVDIRVGSPTFGKWCGSRLSAQDGAQLFVPAGFAHGFAALADNTVVTYKSSTYYSPDAELTVRWDDPTLAIEWPIRDPIVSARDGAAKCLGEFPRLALPTI
jgi:dTDP-4-dehydrorhamnose 3,5-epimerase